jgi:hypothetical protein
MGKKNTIPKDFGKVLYVLIGWVGGDEYNKELANILAEVAKKNGLLKMLVSKDETEKKVGDKVLGFSNSVLCLGLMVGYAFGQWYPFDHPGITKELNCLFSRIPALKKEESAFFTRDMFLKKIADITEDKNVATITDREIEKAATSIVVCWPKNQEAIKDIAGKFRTGFGNLGKEVV